jgi:hypothetical protein
LLATPAGASSVYGPLDNFDVVNDTGSDVCGFEIEIEDVHSGDIYRTFDAPYIRYATPQLIDTATGVIVRYQGGFDPVTRTWLQKTPPAAQGYVPASDSCWTYGLGAAYDTAGCEHFGVSQTRQALSTRYRWLACTADGSPSPLPDIGLPTPVWVVTPPAAPAAPEVVRAEIEIPNPEGTPYGPPYWVKIYKTEAEGRIELEQLLLDDPLQAGAVTEIEWELLQAKPGAEMAMNEAELGEGNEVVVRRYEFYHYDTDWGRVHTYVDPNTGLSVPYVDPENGEVVECVVDGCNDPTPDELGDYIGRQMAGVILVPDACGNGIDDDGDGLVDGGADPGCRDVAGAVENPACQDGIDNDGRPGIDFDGGASANGGVAIDVPDPNCTTAYRATEVAPPVCGIGAEIAFALPLVGLIGFRSRR